MDQTQSTFDDFTLHTLCVISVIHFLSNHKILVWFLVHIQCDKNDDIVSDQWSTSDIRILDLNALIWYSNLSIHMSDVTTGFPYKRDLKQHNLCYLVIEEENVY